MAMHAGRPTLHLPQSPRWDETGAMTVAGYPTAFLPEPGRRLDAGGRPSPLLLPMMCLGAELVMGLGAGRIAEYCRPLSMMIADFSRCVGRSVD